LAKNEAKIAVFSYQSVNRVKLQVVHYVLVASQIRLKKWLQQCRGGTPLVWYGAWKHFVQTQDTGMKKKICKSIYAAALAGPSG